MGESGHSAGQRARVKLERAQQLALQREALRREEETARSNHAKWALAYLTEQRVAERLRGLEGLGDHLLIDRKWPGSRKANVDLVVVGPAGVFIVDTKAWRNARVENGRLYRDQEDATDDVLRLADLAYGAEAPLADIGLPPGEVHAVVVLAGHRGVRATVGPVDVIGEHDLLDHLTRRRRRLGTDQVDRVLAVTAQHFPDYDHVETEPDISRPLPAVPAFPALDDLALLSLEEVERQFLQSVEDAPIEEWMSFLHPRQARLARAEYSGPSRIRGPAGTGKTVVALHRAAYLARATGGRILVTTYVKSLPRVLEGLTHRLAPEVADRIDFMSVHAYAHRLLASRGQRVRIPRPAEESWSHAWRTVGRLSPLQRLDPAPGYWKEEIDWVIKGRGITRLDDYLRLPRTGRRRRLAEDDRRAVWELFIAYEELRTASGFDDWGEVIRRADASLAASPDDSYAAVIVDEVQDLTCAMLTMLARLAGDGPNRLTLIGDGRQTLYPGGFTLAEAGISVQGRAAVLGSNYRNTVEILTAAQWLAGGEVSLVADVEGPADSSAAADRNDSVLRRGPNPTITRFATRSDHDRALLEELAGLIDGGIPPGDVAVLSFNRRDVYALSGLLRAAGYELERLDDYAGRTSSKVKVGTVNRGKGLEFKAVLVAYVPAEVPDRVDSDDPRQSEARDFDRRKIYVAATRARDRLWAGLV